MDTMNEQYSIKNLLFTKAIPNYVIPVPTTGHKVFGCTDCGDKFILASSYDYHINRKSVKISYYCRHCGGMKIFYNRCNLLSHIRSHAFKTATINVTDLKLEPLPLKFFKRIQPTNSAPNVSSPSTTTASPTTSSLASANVATQERTLAEDCKTLCIECHASIPLQGTTMSVGRAKHYMHVTSKTYTCPLCLFTLPTSCALLTHIRFHLRISPYFCPECGMSLNDKNTNYPYSHMCEGFKMMRATVRVKCPAPDCQLLHPNDFKCHLKTNHIKIVHKCPFCYVASFDASMMVNHVKKHSEIGKIQSFSQCDMCPGKLVAHNQLDNHFKAHMVYNYMYPCWICGKIFNNVFTLTTHHLNTHNVESSVRSSLEKLLELGKFTNDTKIYRVVKKCDQCKRSFTYRCKFEQINMLPNECPFDCSASSGAGDAPENQLITCHMCKNKISQNWTEIKKHFNLFHEQHKCIDLKVVIAKTDISKYLTLKRIKALKNEAVRTKVIARRTKKKLARKNTVTINHPDNDNIKVNISNTNDSVCKKCGQECDSKDILEKHLVTHRDPCMAYQCMECGQSFAVKPSFSTHLLLEHTITEVDSYISAKQCYNENAFMKHQNEPVDMEPIRENQCKICREQFENSDDLQKHFRVHGMAFLMKNNSTKPPT